MEEEFLVSSRRLKTLQKTRQQEAWLSRRLDTGQEEGEREKRRWQRWLEGCRRKNGGEQELLSSSSVAVAPTEKRRHEACRPQTARFMERWSVGRSSKGRNSQESSEVASLSPEK
ncbi:hypothetical protein LXL04_037480 [Taraxacum kok-saghyz]